MPQEFSFKNINKLAIPALFAGIAEPLLSITDIAIVGNMDKNATVSLAAVGIVGAFLSMLIWVFGQIRSAISSIVSQYVGANKLDEIKTMPAQAIAIVVGFSLVVLLISYPFATQIFKFYNASGTVLDYSVAYYKIRVFGFPFSLFVFAVFGVFRGLQNTMYPMVIALSGAFLNVFLDIVLVYGITDIVPAMHIEGAAYASVISQVFMAVFSVVLLLKKTPISLKITAPFHPEIKRLMGMILNLFVRTLALNTALYFSTSYATSYGKETIAAYTIGLNLWLLGAFMIDGYSSAGNILSGKLLGAKSYKKLLLLGNKLLRYGFVFGTVIAIIGAIFYKPIGRIFTNDSVVLEQFYTVFWVILAMQPLCGINYVFDGIFKGLGEMKYLRNILILATSLAFIPTLLIFDYYGYKLYAIWAAFFVWIIARGLPLVIIFRKKFSSLAQKKVILQK